MKQVKIKFIDERELEGTVEAATVEGGFLVLVEETGVVKLWPSHQFTYVEIKDVKEESVDMTG